MIRRNRKPRLNQKRTTPHVRSRQASLVPTALAASGNSVQITFALPVVITATPQYLDGASVLPTGATQVDPLNVLVTYPTAPTSPLAVPFEDPAIRGAAGGFVAQNSYVVS